MTETERVRRRSLARLRRALDRAGITEPLVPTGNDGRCDPMFRPPANMTDWFELGAGVCKVGDGHVVLDGGPTLPVSKRDGIDGYTLRKWLNQVAGVAAEKQRVAKDRAAARQPFLDAVAGLPGVTVGEVFDGRGRVTIDLMRVDVEMVRRVAAALQGARS